MTDEMRQEADDLQDHPQGSGAHGRGAAPGTPGWVVRFWAGLLVLALLIGVHAATGGLRHHAAP